MQKSTILLIALLFTVHFSYAQHDALVRYWSFDDNLSDFKNMINGEFSSSLEEGISGKGIMLSDNYLEIKDGVDLMDDFTLSFWFKPKDIQRNQTLFYQFRQVTGQYEIRNFIRLELENGGFVLKSEKGRFGLSSMSLEREKWYSLSYMYDGINTKLFLQGHLIYETNEAISFYEKSYQPVKNRLFIGRCHTAKSQFMGLIDEVKVFQKAIQEEVVAAIYNEFESNIGITNKTSTKEEVLVAANQSIPEVVPNLAMEQAATTYYDEGTEEDIIYVDKYEVLDPLIVRTTSVGIEYYQIKGNGGSEMIIVHNDDFGKPLSVSKEKKIKRIALNIGNENSITFEGFQLVRNQKCRVRVNIKSGSNIIASYDIDLNEHNVILPIAHLGASDKGPKNHKIVTVNSKNIEIQVKDNSKVDGDVITIKQEGRTVLDNYSLTDKLKGIDVELMENVRNEFDFVPVDMGKSSGENTALVLILVDGKVIYDFSLRSVDQNHPARLTIIHEAF